MNRRLGSILLRGSAVAFSASATRWQAMLLSPVGGQTDNGGGYGGYGGGTTAILAFSPSSVTINVGDSVTFVNMGGTHNVHADDGSFRCAKGCDGDGSGGNGNISGADWTSTVTFTKAGIVGYHCDMHVSYGMVGNITVNAVATPPPFTIRSGLSGNWDNPTANQDGHGFQFEILPNNGILAIWFVFTPDGTGQTWLYSQGGYDPTSNTVTLPAYLSLGAKFPPTFVHADDHVTQWGTLTFTFTDCNNGTATWTSTTAGYPPTGSIPIHAPTTIAGTTCP